MRDLEIVRASSDSHFEDLHELRSEWHPAPCAPPRMRAHAGTAVVLLAYSRGSAVGFTQSRHHRGGWDHVSESPPADSSDVTTFGDWIYVKPANRDSGVGAALLDAMVADAQSAGSVTIAIMPDESDTEGDDDTSLRARQRFFERHGFRLSTPGGNCKGMEPWIYIREVARTAD